MTITRAASRLGACLRPVFHTSLGSVRQYSTGPIPKSPISQRFQHLIKPFTQSFGRAGSSKTPYFLAAGIALTSSYCLYHALDNQPAKEASTATEPSEVTDENDLSKDFEAKLEARRFTMVDANGKVYDFGSHFHGYGKGLVKGMNLRFKKLARKDGTKVIELSFRVNHVFHKQLRKKLNTLAKSSPEEQQDFALQCQSKGLKIDRKAHYTFDQKSYPKESAYLITLEGLGSLMLGAKDCYNLQDQVKVTLPEGTKLESIQDFLSIFDLQNALEKSTDEDIERLKAGIVFRTFFPKQAYKIEQDESFFTLPLYWILDATPLMRDLYAQHALQQNIEKKELLPGYVRYGLRVDKTVYALGGRAITTSLTFSHYEEENEPIKEDDLDIVAHVLKNGLFSHEMRNKVGITANAGKNCDDAYDEGGARSVYTQLLTSRDLAAERKVDSLSYKNTVRLYLSLDALNLGSYQYCFDKNGEKIGKQYIDRPNIFKLVRKVENYPFMFDRHEIMIHDRVLPEYIKAMSVETEEIKQRIISRLRQSNLLQKDQDGIERYNGIPIDEFIHTEDHITPELLKRCHQ